MINDDLYCGNCDSNYILKGYKKRQMELKKFHFKIFDKEIFVDLYSENEYQEMLKNKDLK